MRVDGASATASDGFAAVVNEVVRSLPESGGALNVGPGIYTVEETIEIDRPLSFMGVGPGNTTDVYNMTLLVAAEGLADPVVAVTGANADGGFMHGTRIADLGVVGSDRVDTANDCIRFAAENNAHLANMFVERLLVDSAGRHGLHFDDVRKHVIVRDIWSGHHQGDAIVLDSGFRYWLTNCYGYDSKNGIRVSGDATDVSLVGAHCRRSDEDGLSVENGPVQVLGGRFVDNDGTGVAISGTDHVTVAHSESFNNTEYGIAIGGPNADSTRNTFLFGNRIGNVGGGTHVDVSPKSLPSRLKKLGPREAAKRLRKYGVSNVARGYLTNDGIDKSQECGVRVSEDAVDTVLADNRFFEQTGPNLRDAGVRTLVNGLARNEGDPSKKGDWHGHGRPGLEVWDVEGERLYKRLHDGWYGPFATAE